MKRLWVLVAVLALAACGKQTVSTGGGSSVTYSTNPSSLVVRVEPHRRLRAGRDDLHEPSRGEHLWRWQRHHLGPQIMIYPGPVVPNLLVRKLDAAGMQAVLTAAQEAGVLTEPFDYGQPPVADVPDTGVTVNVNDKSYTQGANALGGDFGTENLTQAQIDARRSSRSSSTR